MVPAPTRAEAKGALLDAVKTADRIKDAFVGPAILAEFLNNDMRVGLRRWVDSSFLVPDRRSSGRGVMVELHHDGTVTVSVDVSHGLGHGEGIVVNTQVLRVVALETVVLADTFRRRLIPDSPYDITAVVTTASTNHRLLPFGKGSGTYAPITNSRHPRRLLPASTQLDPNAGDTTLRECAQELTTGLLHQFGINR